MNSEKNLLLKKESLDLTKQLSADNMYRNSAYALFIMLTVAAFFLSLANADFDLAKIGTAQFWIDFAMTFGGSMLLKYAFGKFGNFKGHKHPEVISAQLAVNEDNKLLEKFRLVDTLHEYVENTNKEKKLKKIKEKAWRICFNKSKFRTKKNLKKWENIKDCLNIVEIIEKETDETVIEDLKKLLYARNFDLDLYKVKYNAINVATLKTGSPINNESDDENLTFNEMYELFGKQIIVNILTLIFTIVLASLSVVMDGFSLKAVFTFVARIGTFSMNAYMGFSIGKSSVETGKLNVLNSIHKFLTRFIEIYTNNTSEVK